MSDRPPRRTVLLSFQFLGPALVGSLVMGLVAAFGPPAAQLAALGSLVSILAGLFVGYLGQEADRDRRRADLLETLGVPLALADRPELAAHHRAVGTALTALAAHPDPVLHAIAAVKLLSVRAQLADLAAGTAVFAGTEAWRAVYDQLLASPDLREYRSVAWVRTADYWRDAPGRQSMAANFTAAHRGLLIERVLILPAALWPPGDTLPAAAVRPWVDEQHDHGLHLLLVREDDVAHEPDLLADTGVYGDRAVGTQELDERGRTLRFTLAFDPQRVQLALDRWRRLLLYATPYRVLLDRDEAGR